MSAKVADGIRLPRTHLSPADVKALAAIAASLEPGARCAEIGSYLGASAIVIASSLPPDAKLFCIDTWQNDAMTEGRRQTYQEFTANVRPHASVITPIISLSDRAVGHVSETLDFLFIDGDHGYQGCKADVDAWLPKLKEGAVVALHDVGWAEGVKRVVREDILPIQVGPARMTSNMYWARVGHRRNTAAVAPTARVVVVSSKPAPSRSDRERLQPGLGGHPFTWIFAGRQEDSAVAEAGGLTVVAADDVGLMAGRHKALEIGDEEILIYLDDDVALPDGWLERMLEPFAEPGVHFVGCRYLPDFEHEPPGWMEPLWWERDEIRTLGHLSLLDGGEAARPYKPSLVWGLCFAVRRHTVRALGGFHPDGYPWELRRFRGDGENGLAWKAELLGVSAFYQGETHVFHRIPASRMTPEYFERRSFLQGISDSYTAIRRGGVVPERPRRSWKDVVRPLKGQIQRRSLLRSPTPDGVRLLMARAHMAGAAFHQEEVRRDPALRDWVLKSDYFESRVPRGTQSAALLTS